MRKHPGPCWLTLGLMASCGPVPGEVIGSGPPGASTGVVGSDDTGMSGLPSASTTGVGGSGDATGATQTSLATTSNDGGTTQGVDPDGSGGTSGGTSSGSGASSSGGASSSTTGPLPTCDELYDAAPGYVLCMETDTECHFNADTNGSNCGAMCSMFMGTCIDAFDNEVGCDINRGVDDDCSTNRTTEVCVCSK